jgi:hypothetical protein
VVADTVGLSPEPRSAVATEQRVNGARGRVRVEFSAAPRVWLVATVLVTLGALVSAVAMAPSSSASPGRGLGWLLFVGSSVHVAGTGWFYTLPDVRSHARAHPTRYVYAPIALVALAAVVAAVVPSAGFAWLLLPYFAWQFLHFQKQNLGMAALAASSRGIAGLKPAERRTLMISGWAGIAALVARPGVLQLNIDPGLGHLWAIALLVFGCAVAVGVYLVASRPRHDRPPGFSVVYMTALCFALPAFAFRSPYAAVGGMTIAHGFQYLLLVGLVAAGGPRGTRRALRLAALCNVALIGGVALNAASHLHSGGAPGRFVFGAYLGVVMAHFVIDAGLWRLRDPFPRRFLSTYIPYLVRPSQSRVPEPRLTIDRQPI